MLTHPDFPWALESHGDHGSMSRVKRHLMSRLVDSQHDGCNNCHARPHLMWTSLDGTFFTSTPTVDNALNVLEKTSHNGKSVPVYL